MMAVDRMPNLDLKIFVTGMHMLSRYGRTDMEIQKCGFPGIYTFINQRAGDAMDVVMAKSITGLSDYVREETPDLIIIHGDRLEALAGAIVGSFNNILVAHIEGGEISGTIDELIRHSVTKLSHLHFVSNEEARNRLFQMGEAEENIKVIGSPDLDVMCSDSLPSLEKVREHYDIRLDSYSIFMFHPVTTEIELLSGHIAEVVNALISSNENYVVIYPNNDHGSEVILEELERLRGNPRFCIFPSIRFEYFLTLLKNTKWMIGNSSAGVREAPFYGRPSINIGSRQNGRANAPTIINVKPEFTSIIAALKKLPEFEHENYHEFGSGNSAELFIDFLESGGFWDMTTQKIFVNR
jgi:UDP-N-acetylglucosamine 2-epimerase (hydrolysing)